MIILELHISEVWDKAILLSHFYVHIFPFFATLPLPVENHPKSVLVQIDSILIVALKKPVSIRRYWEVWKDPRAVSRQITAPSFFPGILANVTIPPSYPFNLKDQHNLRQVTVTSQNVNLFLLSRLLAKGYWIIWYVILENLRFYHEPYIS